MKRSATGRRRRGPLWRVLVTGLLLGGLSIPAVAIYNVSVASVVPGVSTLLSALSPWLPAEVAWRHSAGSAQLHSGAYLGWTDGNVGQLYLAGEGCTNGITSLLLYGDSTLELLPDQVTSLWLDLNDAVLTPVLLLHVALPTTTNFDRAVLRCRDATEYRSRLAATVVFVPPNQLTFDPLKTGRASTDGTGVLVNAGENRVGEDGVGEDGVGEDGVGEDGVGEDGVGEDGVGEDALGGGLVSDVASFPGVGLIGKLQLVAGAAPVTVLGLEYAPPAATTDQVLAAAGHSAALPVWLWQALVESATAMSATALQHASTLPEPKPLTPWDHGYASVVGPHQLLSRRATGLDLLIEPSNVSIMVVSPASYVRTAVPRPVLSKLVLKLEFEGQVLTLVPDGLAFGWTARP